MKHHGLYTVKDKTFRDKLEAIIYASQKGLGPESLTWDYYSDIFKSFDITQEPEGSLDFFYKERANQIREQYDYVVLFSSGGADSVQMCESFLSNGIMVDEIVASAPISGLSNWKCDDKNTSPENTVSETFLAQLPHLKDLAAKYSVKITINDYFKTILNYKESEWLLKSSDWMHPTALSRFTLNEFEHIRKLAESGKKIAMVYGLDKPKLYLNNEGTKFYLAFLDFVLNTMIPPFDENYNNIDTLAFYWTPEFPLLPIKQAHVMAKFVCLPENKHILELIQRPFEIFKRSTEELSLRQSRLQRLVCPGIYPNTWVKRFQAEKQSFPIMAQHDYWFYKLHNNLNSSFDMMKSDINNFFQSIDSSFNVDKKRTLPYYLNYYYLGSVKNFSPSDVLDK